MARSHFPLPAAVLLILTLALAGASPAASQKQGFVSIDCGGLTNYTDGETRLSWTSDSHGFGLENVSRVANVSSQAPKYRWLSSMRIFEGNQSKYCYEFNYDSHGIMQSAPYLVRASFWTGDEAPFSLSNNSIQFKLLINADEWESIDISLPQEEPLVKEMYVVAVLPTISVCVAGQGEAAFISALELRPISKNFSSVQKFMQATENAPRAMFLYARIDLGSAYDVRYPNDTYDRIWSKDNREGYFVTGRPSIETATHTIYTTVWEEPPSVVLQTALVDAVPFNITFNGFSRSYNFFYLIFFAEVSDNGLEQQRIINEETITAAGVMWYSYNLDLAMLTYSNDAFYNEDLLPVDEDGFLTFSLDRGLNSSLGPLVNAIELLYSSPGPMLLGTNDDDVHALDFMKESLPRFDSWRGDPCLPYSYEWLTCDSEIRPRIIKLSLQNRNITAEIPTDIGSLKALTEINLQGNNFGGSIPQSIAQLPNLTTLYLQDNNLSGPIPQELLDGKVDLRLVGNLILCKDNNAIYCDQQSVQTKTDEGSKKSHMLLVAILAPICAVVLIVVAFIVYFRRKHMNPNTVAITHEEVIKYSNLAQHFTFQQIEGITNHFSKKLGAGGFGDVFLGMLSTGLNVAVKVSSQQGRAQEGPEFLNEVALLSRVHHKNLVEFVGYCIQPKLILVYEYMSNRSLDDNLHGKYNVYLPWRDRLNIVVGAAQGLEYLHKGCKPLIIHRDVKCSNILLDENLEAKISDFGISRSKPTDTHMTVTHAQGTVGYMAPEYAELRITEKIDVFAFGVVLLEVVSGRRPAQGSEHIMNWVRPLMDKNQIEAIVDPSIGTDYSMSSVWTVLEVAMACVEQDARRRPDMHEVASELQSALSFELQNGTVLALYDSTDLPFDTETVHTR